MRVGGKIGLITGLAMVVLNYAQAVESNVAASNITFRTDKEVYLSGEIVKVEARFPEHQTFFLPQYGLEALPTHLGLQRRGKDGSWGNVDMYADLPEGVPLPTPVLHFRPISGCSAYGWNQMTNYKLKTLAIAGVYRFTIMVYSKLRGGISDSKGSLEESAIDKSSQVNIESNEFTIK